MNRSSTGDKVLYEKEPYFIYLEYDSSTNSWEVRLYRCNSFRVYRVKGDLADAKNFSEETLLKGFSEAWAFFYPPSALKRVLGDPLGKL